MQKERVWQNPVIICLLSYFLRYRQADYLALLSKTACTHEAVNIFSFQCSVKVKFSLFLYEKYKYEKIFSFSVFLGTTEVSAI